MDDTKQEQLTFDDIPLIEAIAKVIEEQDDEFPAGDRRFILEGPRKRFYKAVITKLIEINCRQQYDMDRVMTVGMRYRKNKKTRLIPAIVKKRGSRQCWCANEKCTNKLHVDRIQPGSQGGEYTTKNGILSCSYHNGARKDKDFVQYANLE